MTILITCTHCNQAKPQSAFPRRGFYKDGTRRYSTKCKVCTNADYRAKHPPTVTRNNYTPDCMYCKFLKPCRKIVTQCITRDVVIDGVSTRIYLDPYCFITSPLYPEFQKVYRTNGNATMV